MTNPPATRLAKLHLLQILFRDLTGSDLSLARQLKAAIDFSVTGSLEADAPWPEFVAAVQMLMEASPDRSEGIELLDLTAGFDPLWAREAALSRLKRLAGYERGLLLVTGLRSALCPPPQSWSRRHEVRLRQAIGFLDDLGARWHSAGTRLTLLYF